MFLEPAASIITLLGGPSAASRSLGTGANAPFRWRSPSHKLGTNGYIPPKYHDRIIAVLAERGIDLPRAAFVDSEVAQEFARRHRQSEAGAAA